ncbi:MAG: NAD(P)/FAD-dependent oxidoreductase [Solirubrobacterales bacterium]
MSGALAIVGGGPAGLAAARAWRDGGGSGPVVMFTDDGAPYERPPLSKEYLRGERRRGDLVIEPAGWYADNEIELRDEHVDRLDVDARTLTTAAGQTSFGWCLLATGSRPKVPDVPGAHLAGVHVLRSALDADVLRGAIALGAHAVVVGSGFIGCEAAVSMAAGGARVTVVSADSGPQAERLGSEVADRLDGWLGQEGIIRRYDTSLRSIERSGSRLAVEAGEGPSLPADVVLLAVGAEPRTDLAVEAGLETEDGGGVLADERLETSAPGVYVAGDIAYAHNAAAGRRVAVQHWGDALTQGEIAAKAMLGGECSWSAAPGFWASVGSRKVKYVGWGDGHDEIRPDFGDDGSFSVRYGADGRTVGVLTHGRDDLYEQAAEMVRAGVPL